MAAFVSAAEAAAQVRDQATVVLSGNTYRLVAESVLMALEARFLEDGPAARAASGLPDHGGAGPCRERRPGHRREPAGQAGSDAAGGGRFLQPGRRQGAEPAGHAGRRRGLQPAHGHDLRVDPRDGGRQSWPRDAGRHRHVRRSPSAGGPHERGDPDAARRARDPGGRRGALLSAAADRRGHRQGDDRGRAREHRARARSLHAGRALHGDGRSELRRNGHRRGDAHGGRRVAPSESGGHPGAPGGLRRGGARGVRGRARPGDERRDPRAAPAGATAARREGRHRPSGDPGVRARQRREPGSGHPDVRGPARGVAAGRCPADQLHHRAGADRGASGGGRRGGGAVGDPRLAPGLRLVRRGRHRCGVPVVRRGGPVGQRQRRAVRRHDAGLGRLHQHRPRRPQDRLLRDADGQGPPDDGEPGRSPDRAGGRDPTVRAGCRAGHVQRRGRREEGPGGGLRDRARGLPPGAGRHGAHRDRPGARRPEGRAGPRRIPGPGEPGAQADARRPVRAE